MKKLGLLIIGDEILSGKIDDLNLKWLAKFILKEDIDLHESLIVKDRRGHISDALDHLLESCDVVITSGGLGPTEDDITKMTLTEYFNTELDINIEVEKFVVSQYAKIHKDWDRSKNQYHLFPKGAKLVKNNKGLAPGIMFKKDNKLVFATPGVPKEFQVMVQEEIIEEIKSHYQLQSSAKEYLHIRTFGIPEEEIFNVKYPKLWDQLSEHGKVSSLPTITGVDISMTLDKNEDTLNKIQKIKNIINSIELREKVWHYGSETLQEVIVQKAKEKSLTIGFCESCTGGLSSSKITDIPGSSSVFLGSVIAYSNDIKENILNVQSKTLKEFGAVSKEVAHEMALGGRECLKVDICLSYTGIAGPGGGTLEKPVGTVAIGLSSKQSTTSKRYQFYGDRLKLKERFSQLGLIKLLHEIEKY